MKKIIKRGRVFHIPNHETNTNKIISKFINEIKLKFSFEDKDRIQKSKNPSSWLLIISSILMIIAIFYLTPLITGLVTFTDSVEANFSLGTFINTTWNYSDYFIQLNFTDHKNNNTIVTNGTFLSRIYDATGSTTWNNITWSSSAVGEMSGNQKDEIADLTFGMGNVNMTGNIVLLHFDNNSNFGENQTRVYDFSGSVNNGTAVFEAHPNLTSSIIGAGSYNFDGVDDYVRISDSVTTDISGSAMSFAVWVQPFFDQTATAKFIFDKTLDNAEAYRVLLVAAEDDWRFRLFTTSGVVNCDTTDVVWTPGTWHHLAASYNGNNIIIYWDGEFETLCSQTGTITTNNDNLLVGVDGAATGYYAGNIDELAIWNRSLSGTDVRNIYRRGINRLNISVRSCNDSLCAGESFTEYLNGTSFSNLSVPDNRYFQYRVILSTELNQTNATYSPRFYNATVDYDAVSADTTAPNVTGLIPASNTIFNKRARIEIAANVTDANGISTVLANITLANSSIVLLTLSNTTGNPSKFNNTYTITTLTSNYNITFIANDTTNNINNTQITNFTVSNSAPSNVTLLAPINGTTSLTNRTVNFIFANATDADDDPISYNLRVDDNQDFTSPDINVNITESQSGTNVTHFSTVELSTDTTYFWQIIANDSNTYNRSAIYNFQVASTVSLTLTTSNIDFGAPALGDTVDTTTNNPSPIIIENDGNVLTDINLSLTDDLWLQATAPSTFFRYKVDNTTSEPGSFNATGSITAFTNVPLVPNNQTIIAKLNYSNSNDTAELDFEITVPTDEPDGNRSAILTITGWASA